MAQRDAGTDLIQNIWAKLQSLENKVDALQNDRATRSDIEKLRDELMRSMVPRDAYEPRHSALVERDTQIEQAVRDVRRDMSEQIKTLEAEIERAAQRIHDRLESGKQQIEDRLKQVQEADLSTKDRNWLRVTQLMSIAAIVSSLIELLLGHIHFS